MWSRSELKERAKEVLHLNYWKAVLVSLIYSFLSGSGGGSASGSSSTSSEDYSNGGSYSGLSSEDLAVLGVSMIILAVIVLTVLAVSLALGLFVFNPLIAGCHRFFLNCGKGNASLNDLTYAFSNSYMNVVKIMFFKGLYTFLWSLLFIVPGVIKGLEYRMIPYLLAENPSLSKEEAFRLSKEMMDGDKWNAFVLDWSFFGWELLGAFTCCILSVFYVAPYENLTKAELYNVLKKKISGNSSNNSYQQNPYEPTDTTSGTFYQNPYL